MKLLNSFKLKTKIAIINLIIIVSLSLLSFYVLNTSSLAYDSIILEQTQSILELYSSNFEQNLDYIEQLSYKVLIDNEVQTYLVQLNSGDAYTRHQQKDQIENQLLEYMQGNKYISSMIIIDNTDYHYTSGLSSPKMNFQHLVDKSQELDGKIFWSVDPHYPGKLILTRAIREINGLSLKKIGTLVMTINFSKLININDDNNGRIIISDMNGILYSSDRIDTSSINAIKPDIKSYTVQSINDNLYIINRSYSKDTGFVYTYLLDYDYIFKDLISLQKQMLTYIFLVGIISLLLGIIYSKTVTKPLETLCVMMQDVQENDFKLKERQNKYPPKSEIGYLYHEFEDLVRRIDNLVNDQLLSQIILIETKYKVLQSQINPHFLYNTLDSINWLAQMHQETEIAKMVKSLAHIMRNSIDTNNQLTTVKDEINLLNHYIYIQQIRYEDRLDYNYLVSPRYESLLIPKMIIQPLLENAIQYALEPTEDVCHINLIVKTIDQKIIISVKDNGIGVHKDTIDDILSFKVKPKGNGIGLKNIIERLSLLYNDDYIFTFESQIGIGTEVKIQIPIDERMV